MAKQLEPPFPSSPHRPPRYSFQFFRGDKRVMIQNFFATYAASRYIDAVVGDNEIRWRGEDAFIVPDLGVTIKGDNLETVMEYESKGAEAEWELPEPHATDAKFIATGERRKASPPARMSEDDTDRAKQRGDKPKRSGPPRAVPDGMISLAAICEGIGMAPRDARAILRKKADKPDHGWAWPAAEANKIKAMLAGKNNGGDNTPAPKEKNNESVKTVVEKNRKAPQAAAGSKKKR